jgi:hypothetical protein
LNVKNVKECYPNLSWNLERVLAFIEPHTWTFQPGKTLALTAAHFKGRRSDSPLLQEHIQYLKHRNRNSGSAGDSGGIQDII